MFYQKRDIGRMFSERRHANRKPIQAVIEIRSKASLSDSSLQVTISRGNHAHIQFSLLVRADGAYFALLKDAKQPYLRRKGRFANLVEKDGAPVRLLK